MSPTREELEAALADGGAVCPDDLAGYAFRGVSLGLPAAADRLLWKTFAKVFVRSGAEVRGFNLRIVQGDIDNFCPQARRPRFGEFVAQPTGTATTLDYSLCNPRWHPLAAMRDHLVAIEGDVYLGRTRLAVGGAQFNTPSFFTLTRGVKLNKNVPLKRAHLELDWV